jgi:hypothetical protein
MVAEAGRESIFHFSFDIFHLPSPEFIFGTRRQMASRPPRRYRLESGLVRLAQPGGTSALSKRRVEKNGTRDIPGPMANEKWQIF